LEPNSDHWFRKFQSNIKILSSQNLFCRRFAVLVGKLQLSTPSAFLGNQ